MRPIAAKFSRPPAAAVFFRNVDTKLPDLTIQGARVDAEIPGGECSDAFMLAEGLSDQYVFHGLEIHPARVRGITNGLSPQIRGQVVGWDHPAVREHQGMLYDILKLSNIPGKVMLHEDREGFG